VLCATLWRTEQRVRKHDSVFEGERTRPLSLVNAPSRLYLENVPVEHFQQVNTIKLISVLYLASTTNTKKIINKYLIFYAKYDIIIE
jgi:hypothetical protein